MQRMAEKSILKFESDPKSLGLGSEDNGPMVLCQSPKKQSRPWISAMFIPTSTGLWGLTFARRLHDVQEEVVLVSSTGSDCAFWIHVDPLVDHSLVSTTLSSSSSHKTQTHQLDHSLVRQPHTSSPTLQLVLGPPPSSPAIRFMDSVTQRFVFLEENVRYLEWELPVALQVLGWNVITHEMHVITVLLLIAVVEAAVAIPVSKRDYEDFLNEMAKRDLEETVFLTPPESLAFVVDLPRTDRKNLAEQEAILKALGAEDAKEPQEAM
uniref:GB1/RHD3-type G domain-containing protein n=1 Tax=Steinernema glaseri TaxID=37863 RepID=A0A1I7Z1M2_9BILA